MAEIVHFPSKMRKPAGAQVKNRSEDIDLFRDLSDLIGVDLHKVVVEQDQNEMKKLHKTLQKNTMKIRSSLTN